MSRLFLIVAALALTGCASNSYRYYDDGYYAAEREPSRAVVFSGSFSTCYSWGQPYGYPYYGYGYRPAYGCGYGFGYGYGYGYGGWYGGGYWGYPYWSGGWHPPQTPNGPTAGQRARQMAGGSIGESPEFPRYDDLAPERGRDSGGGGRAGASMAPRYSYPSYYQGFGGSRSSMSAPSGLSGEVRRGGASGLSGGLGRGSQSMPSSSRADFGPRSGFGDRGPSASGSARFSEPARSSAAGQARSISRDAPQQEE